VPELRHLRYFVAVAEELNFSRAARRLRMAQPPLSVAIRQLEQELGAELFVRSSREVTLTEAGRTLLDGARRTLTEAERAMSDARRAGAGELGSLRLAFSWSARFETLPALGRALKRELPDLALHTEEMWNARMPSALRVGSLDVAVSLCPEIVGELSYEPIRREAVVALLDAQHALAGKRSIPLGALAEEDFVLFPRELAPRLHDALVGVCRSAGFEPKVRSESFHSGWELGVLAELPVIAIVPASVGRDLPEGVTAVALSEPTDRLETHLVWRADDSSATLAAFLEVARGVFEPLLPTSGPSGVAPGGR
jgi:LysR family transcriptional regulator, benzoate and cis,cis-muconate-responsive activator of ben and cat genes